jgi:HK97 family phage prohead protease
MKDFKLQDERRELFNHGCVSVREEADQAGIITGCAIVTNKETILYEGADWREVEVIDPSAINADFIRQQDIKLNLLHQRNDSIARTPNSLRVESREDGLYFEADIPDCDLGQRAQALIANGTYTGCSFEFYPQDYTVQERTGADGKMEYVIRHTAFRAVTALTLAMDPAYPTTTVGLREAFMEDNKEGIRERLETIKPTIIPSGRFRREVEINNINNMYNH